MATDQNDATSTLDDLVTLLSDPDRGLDGAEVDSRLQRYGLNTITRHKGRGAPSPAPIAVAQTPAVISLS
ncbi:MAG: hypothetical protein GX630_08705 [Actinobacteria bacterium]|nr:hypothetical protein [Actinomycetota bacterium]